MANVLMVVGLAPWIAMLGWVAATIGIPLLFSLLGDVFKGLW